MNSPKSSTGLKKETAAALSYVFGPITGVIFTILEDDPLVRFHAMQSTVVLGVLGLAALVIGSFIPPVGSLLWLAYFLVFMFGAFKASQGEKWEVPVLMSLFRKRQSR